jgi:trans-aconitate 2-methyltransferase
VAWDPDLYLKFDTYRCQPAIDLLARIDLTAPARVFDLGCGPGNVTTLLLARWPGAKITGLDSSQEMLAQARDRDPSINWVQEDISAFTLKDADLIFSNAAFNWVPDHEQMIPRLVAGLSEGGVLAVQMPRNYAQPSHTEILECIAAQASRNRLNALVSYDHVQPPAFYYDVLAPLVQDIEVWEINYTHILSGNDPVLAWFMATAMRPMLDVLEGTERSDFLEDMRARYRAAYPPRSDGNTLFELQRLFLMARR